MDHDHAFVCGNPALYFAATLRARRTVRFEMSRHVDQLDAWFVESGLVDNIVPGDEADVEQAKSVREAIYELVTARRLKEEYDDEALSVLNGTARKSPATPQLTRTGRRTEATAEQAL